MTMFWSPVLREVRLLMRYLPIVVVLIVAQFLPFWVGLVVKLAVMTHVLVALVRLPFLAGPCMFCDRRPAINRPRQLTPLPWWKLAPTQRDVIAVCDEHLPTYLRMPTLNRTT